MSNHKLNNEMSDSPFNFSSFSVEKGVSNDIYEKFKSISAHILKDELSSAKSIENREFPKWLESIKANHDFKKNDLDIWSNSLKSKSNGLKSKLSKEQYYNQDYDDINDYDFEFIFDFHQKYNLLQKIKTRKARHQFFEKLGSNVEEAFQQIDSRTLTAELKSAKFVANNNSKSML